MVLNNHIIHLPKQQQQNLRLLTLHIINLQCIIELNVQSEIIKFLKENRGGNLCDDDESKDFLEMI